MCFVIGPIGAAGSEERKHADFLLHGLIKHVLEAGEFGYAVKRADEDADPDMITDRMISDITNAELVVADLTGLNANAFYELGICHSAERPVIHIAKASTVLPFDNVTHRATFVDVSDWRSLVGDRGLECLDGPVAAGVVEPYHWVEGSGTRPPISKDASQSSAPKGSSNGNP